MTLDSQTLGCYLSFDWSTVAIALVFLCQKPVPIWAHLQVELFQENSLGVNRLNQYLKQCKQT